MRDKVRESKEIEIDVWSYALHKLNKLISLFTLSGSILTKNIPDVLNPEIQRNGFWV